MTERTLRDRLHEIAYRDEAKTVTVRTDDLKAVLAFLDAHTAAKPAPDAVADAWQPIETAPKDGTWVLGFRPRIAVQDQIQCYCWNAFGCTDDLWVNATDTNDFDEQPTHWQPLPAPPAKGHQP